MERYGSQSRVDVNSVARNKVFRAVNKIRGAAFFLGNLAKSRTNDMSLMEREVLKTEESVPKALEEEPSVHEETLEGQIVMWRPSVRVRLATDLPAALLKPLPEKRAHRLTTMSNGVSTPKSANQRKPRARDRSPEPKPASIPRSQSVEPLARPPWNSIQTSPVADKPRYGAWYLPVKRWKVEKGETPGIWEKKDANVHDTDGMDLDTGLSAKQEQEKRRVEDLNNYQSKLDKQMTNLYSGKMYKEYILKQGERIPHYLEKVGTLNPIHDEAAMKNRATGRTARRMSADFKSRSATASPVPHHLPPLSQSPSRKTSGMLASDAEPRKRDFADD